MRTLNEKLNEICDNGPKMPKWFNTNKPKTSKSTFIFGGFLSSTLPNLLCSYYLKYYPSRTWLHPEQLILNMQGSSGCHIPTLNYCDPFTAKLNGEPVSGVFAHPRATYIRLGLCPLYNYVPLRVKKNRPVNDVDLFVKHNLLVPILRNVRKCRNYWL